VRERPPGLRPERLGDVRCDHDPAERQVAAGDALGERDQVGAQPEALDAEPAAEPPEASDHRVGDREDAVVRADLHRPPVAGWRGNAPRADHRLEDERGDGLGPE
jgi:hypothetical protein